MGLFRNIILTMKKGKQKILFFIFLLIFLIVAPILVLYAQGYRFDLRGRKITQTGGIFIKATPRQAQIYLDNKLVKTTDFLFGSALIENLLPQKHHIVIQKEGFYSWEKNLETKEKEVTEARNIILFPKDSYYRSLAQDVEQFWFSPDGRTIVLKESKQDSWALKLYNLERNVKSHIISEDDLSPKGAVLSEVDFSDKQREIILEVAIAEQLKYFSSDISGTAPLLEEINPPPETPSNVVALFDFQEKRYYLDIFGYIYQTDEAFSTKQKLNSQPFPIKHETEYKLYVFSEWIFVQERDTLYLFNQETQSFEKFFEGVSSLKISPNLNKLLYFSQNEIWILFLNKQGSQPKREKGERVFLLRLSEKIKDVFWIRPEYLIFNTKSDTKIIETDNRDRTNIVHWAEFKDSEIFWNQYDKSLYVLDKGNLLVSEKLIQ